MAQTMLRRCRVRWYGTIIAQEYGKGGFERIPISDALLGQDPRPTQRSDLISVPEEEWRAAVRQFEILKPLLKLSRAQRTLARVQKAADALGRHPATIYRWIEKYRSAGRF
jgi:putative transposase